MSSRKTSKAIVKSISPEKYIGERPYKSVKSENSLGEYYHTVFSENGDQAYPSLSVGDEIDLSKHTPTYQNRKNIKNYAALNTLKELFETLGEISPNTKGINLFYDGKREGWDYRTNHPFHTKNFTFHFKKDLDVLVVISATNIFKFLDAVVDTKFNDDGAFHSFKWRKGVIAEGSKTSEGKKNFTQREPEGVFYLGTMIGELQSLIRTQNFLNHSMSFRHADNKGLNSSLQVRMGKKEARAKAVNDFIEINNLEGHVVRGSASSLYKLCKQVIGQIQRVQGNEIADWEFEEEMNKVVIGEICFRDINPEPLRYFQDVINPLNEEDEQAEIKDIFVSYNTFQNYIKTYSR